MIALNTWACTSKWTPRFIAVCSTAGLNLYGSRRDMSTAMMSTASVAQACNRHEQLACSTASELAAQLGYSMAECDTTGTALPAETHALSMAGLRADRKT